MIRLIAIDMDGTLLNQNHQITLRNKEAILQAQKEGIEVIIATGRGFPEAEHPVSQANLELSYICLNGSEMRDKNGNVLSAIDIQKEEAKKILAVFQQESIETLLFVNDYMYVKSIEDLIRAFIELGKDGGLIPDVPAIRAEVMDRVDDGYVRTTHSFETLIAQNNNQIYKFFGSSSDPHALKRAAQSLKSIKNIAVTSSGTKNIEVTNIQAQKGIALERYMNENNISKDQLMVIGDSHNDLSMIKKAKISFAMENAPEDVKEACTHVTLSNEKDGVAKAIESVLRKQTI